MLLPSRRTILAALAAAGAAAAVPGVAMAQDAQRKITADNPYVIANPKLGFVNLLREPGRALMEQDQAALAPLFNGNVEVAAKTLPRCNVLFLYCALDASTHVAGLSVSLSFRDVVKATGAHVAVLASDTDDNLFNNPDFGKSLSAHNDWPANIVITLKRNGEHFDRFFRALFAQMFAGTSMPMAFVDIAPQGPVQSKDLPETLFLMEGGHIAFAPQKA